VESNESNANGASPGFSYSRLLPPTVTENG
jgi:hypothetical protein